jgi:biuret amidohydrolase
MQVSGNCAPSLRAAESGQAVRSTGRKARRARDHFDRFKVRGEPGNAIVAACAPAPGEIVIDKPGKGMFYATNVAEILKERGITRLVFGSVTPEVCVQTSMREANDPGYECLLIEDATASDFPRFKAALNKALS